MASAQMASLPFEGRMSGSSYEIAYVAQEAGTMDLHLWATELSPADGDDEARKEGGALKATREPLPGSPFTVHVSEGNASATGSFVTEAVSKQAGEAASKQGTDFIAGEHIILRPQVGSRPAAAA